jgi:beta-phosphoglucomutase
MPNIKVCFFDIEGVLCNTLFLHYQAWLPLLENLGFELDEEQFESLYGLNDLEILEKILLWNRYFCSEDDRIAMLEQKNQQYAQLVYQVNETATLTGVISLLKSIKAKNIKTIITSHLPQTHILLSQLQLISYFDDIIDYTIVENVKPDAEIYDKAVAISGFQPRECLAFEAQLDGIRAAMSAGCFTVGIGDMKTLKRANLVISSIEDISFEEMLDCLYN